METWYEVRRWGPNYVNPVNVDSSTEKFVVIKGQRSAKQSDYYCYFPTESEAHQLVMKRASDKLERAKTALAQAESEFWDIKARYAPKQ